MNKKIISFLVLFIALIPACYAQIDETEKDGFKWSKTWKGKFVVAYDEFGNEIIPASKGFNYINYEPNPDGDSYGYFRVQKGSKYGAYDVMGNEVIPPVSKYPYKGIYNVKTADGKKVMCAVGNNGEIIIPVERGYTEITKRETPLCKGYYKVKIKNNEGICDLQGNEIIPPRYKSVFFHENKGCFAVKEGKDYVNLDISLDYEGNVCSKSLRDSLDSNISIEDLFQKAYELPESDYLNKQTLYRKVIALDSDNSKGFKALAYNNLGASWEARDEPKMAKTYYQLAVNTDPTFALAAENLERAKKTAREKKWNSVINTLETIGGVLNTASDMVNAFSGNTAAATSVGGSTTTSTHTNNDVDILEAKAAKAKEDARLTPLKNRDSNVYQDYEGQLSSMKTFPERYDDQQRRTIQMKMKQIRTKWEQKGFKMYHSEWENWDGSH